MKLFDCRGNIGTKDNSTMHKHWISTRHYHKAVGDDRLHTQPGYTCPAFLSMHSLCTNAEYAPPAVLCSASILTVAFRAGRYESAYRHCESCAGFQQVQVESGVDVTPVELTRGEYRVPQKCAARPGYLFWANPERRVQRDHDDCH